MSTILADEKTSRKDESDEGQPIKLLAGRTITLYDANELATVQDMAYTLSHEYGHLFTYYWIIEKEHKLPNDLSTQWANIRQLDSYPVRWVNSSLDYNHYWQPEEIMANDYAEMFGSKDAKIRLFYSPDQGKNDTSFINNLENTVIPAAESVNGLREYWEGLAGIHVPADTLDAPTLIDLKVNLNGNQVKYTVSFNPATNNPSKNIRYFMRWSTQSQISYNGSAYLSGDT